MGPLDIRTLALVLAAVTIISTLILLTVWASRKVYGGFGSWAIANVALSLGALLISLQGLIPDLFSKIIGSLLPTFGVMLFFIGFRKFFNLPYHDYLNYSLFAIVAISTTFFLYIHDDVNARIVIISFFWTILFLRTAATFFANTADIHGLSIWFTGLVLIGNSLVNLFRGSYFLFNPLATNLLTPNTFTGFYFLAGIILTISLTFSFIMLTAERLEMELKAAEEEARNLATIDFLTGASNRRNLFTLGQLELNRARRYERPLGLLLLDIDRFKMINDTYGHSAGDTALKTFTDTALSQFRNVDIFARIGGDEFVILLPDTNLPDCLKAGEKFQQTLSTIPFIGENNDTRLSCCIGVTLFHPEDEGIETILKRADMALYEAKVKGLSCIVTKDFQAE